MKKLFILLLLSTGYMVFAQETASWHRELEAALVSPSQNNGLAGSYNFRWRAKEPTSWNRVDADIRVQYYLSGTYYLSDQGLRNDSGQTTQLNLSWGKEIRRNMNDHLALQAGFTVGGGYRWNNKTTSTWESGNINEIPDIQRFTNNFIVLRAAPYMGMMLWGSKWVGFSGQVWLPVEGYRYQTGGTASLEFRQQLEFRIGMNLRLYGKQQTAKGTQ